MSSIFSRSFEVMKELQPWRFILVWIWLMALDVTPLLFAIARLIEAH